MFRQLVVLAALLGLAGCGPEVWTAEREVDRVPEERELASIVPRIDPLLGDGDERRFSLTLERVWQVRGKKEIEVVRFERPYSPIYESGEMLIGILVTPFYVVLFPALYPLNVGIQEDEASIGKYFAVVPERFLNPTRNDLFQEDVEEAVVERRSDPYEDRFVEDVPPDERKGLSIELVELVARFREEGRTAPVAGARIERGETLVFSRPGPAVDEYVLTIRVGGAEHAVRFQDY